MSENPVFLTMPILMVCLKIGPDEHRAANQASGVLHGVLASRFRRMGAGRRMIEAVHKIIFLIGIMFIKLITAWPYRTIGMQVNTGTWL